jgi:Trp operon repressor
MIGLDMSAAAITARLRFASELVSNLAPERRLETKLEMSPAAITRRLRECAALLDTCRRLEALGQEDRARR